MIISFSHTIVSDIVQYIFFFLFFLCTSCLPLFSFQLYDQTIDLRVSSVRIFRQNENKGSFSQWLFFEKVMKMFHYLQLILHNLLNQRRGIVIDYNENAFPFIVIIS